MNEPGTHSAAVDAAYLEGTGDAQVGRPEAEGAAGDEAGGTRISADQVAHPGPEPGAEPGAVEERITLRMQIHLAKPSHGIVLRGGPKPKPRRRGRIPRVARMLALAHRFAALLERGVVPTQTELARLTKLTTARVTQIMNLLVLAPDIQEALLFWPPVTRGRKTVTMRQLGPVLETLVWSEQRARWAEIRRAYEDVVGAMPGPAHDPEDDPAHA